MGGVLSVQTAVPCTLVVAYLVVYRVILWIFNPLNVCTDRKGINDGSLPKKVSEIPWSNELKFFLNGRTVRLINPDPGELLATYIRDKAGLKGTKLGCEEGGCGACTVVLRKDDGTIAVNSCLRPLCTNDGMSITTVEGIGSVSSGLSAEQASIVSHNGTQCGYCTPGWISNSHARNMATEEGSMPEISGVEIDQYFDGNICRCTGYKPILKAIRESSAKSCSDASTCRTTGICSNTGGPSCHTPIEDIGSNHIQHALGVSGVGSGAGRRSTPRGSRGPGGGGAGGGSEDPQPLHFFNPSTNTHWYRPVDLSQLCSVLQEYRSVAGAVQLVGGNTSIGVTKYFNDTAPYNSQDKYSVFVDMNSIPELCESVYDPVAKTLRAGATATLTELITLLNAHANRPTDSDVGLVDHYSVFSVTAHHLRRIANTQVCIADDERLS